MTHHVPDHLREEAREWRERPHDPSKYADYLRSPLWRWVRDLVRQRSGGTCERCGFSQAAHTHHQTYDSVYREYDDLQSLVAVCGECHDAIHGRSSLDPAQYRSEWDYLIAKCDAL